MNYKQNIRGSNLNPRIKRDKREVLDPGRGIWLAVNIFKLRKIKAGEQ